jgi:hypothetical protein
MPVRLRSVSVCHGPHLIAFFGIHSLLPLPENSPEQLFSFQESMVLS